MHVESFAALVAHLRRGRQGAFERTADELGVDRSVLRRRIQTLGEWVGAPILEGRGTEARPTPQGARLAEHATRLVEAAGRLRVEVTQANDRVVIACTGTITSELLPRIVLDLEKRPSPIQLVVRRAGGAACETLVRSGEADLGVVRADEPPRGLVTRTLSSDRLWFVMPAHHPRPSNKRPTLAEMARVPLVLYGESSRTRARVMDRLRPHGASIRIEVEGRSAALAYVRAGVGATFLSLLPGHAIDRKRVRAYDVTALFDRSAFYVIATKQRWSSASIAAVVTELSKAV